MNSNGASMKETVEYVAIWHSIMIGFILIKYLSRNVTSRNALKESLLYYIGLLVVLWWSLLFQ